MVEFRDLFVCTGKKGAVHGFTPTLFYFGALKWGMMDALSNGYRNPHYPSLPKLKKINPVLAQAI